MRFSLTLAAVAALSACVPYTGYYRAGVPVAQFETDRLECEVLGAQRVPPNTQVRSRDVYVPPRQVCTPKGKCRLIDGDFVSAGIESYDANADLRARVVGQCMASRGYGPVRIDACTGEGPRRVPSVLPPAGSACALSRGGRTDFALR
ncbi:hypothetical protein DXV76_12310 [Rhodobacteraceae bacterium CCMM004]|nr:hypothetical protein DXV76_12310 [Rhodobacteraceae bacterium CCMM004]